jgi:hypothetical protein
MSRIYERDGVLEGDCLIRLKEPLPCKEGPVKVTVAPEAEVAEPAEGNRAALEALDRLLREPDELTPERWAELERVIEEHPLRIRKGVPRRQ